MTTDPIVYLVETRTGRDWATFDRSLVEHILGPLDVVRRPHQWLALDSDATVRAYAWVNIGTFPEDALGSGVAVAS